MNINAAPRLYTSSLVADSDLNMGQHNIKANAIFPRDNYLLSILSKDAAFPQNVQEGDKVFKWGADSTTSYIHTYLNGSWDAGVEPQHLQDYYVADEHRTVRFCLLKGHTAAYSMFYDSFLESRIVQSHQLLTFEPNVYILGNISLLLDYRLGSTGEFVVPADSYVIFDFTDCTTRLRGSKKVDIGGISISSGVQENISVVIPSGVNAFTGRLSLYAFGSVVGNFSVSVGYQFDV